MKQQLIQLIQPQIEMMGFEFVGLQYFTQGKRNTLRIYIDHSDGINIEHCTQVSHQVSGILDVEDPINAEYHLEVSSPGLDRPLFNIQHYKKFTGKKVKLKLLFPIDGQRKFQGEIKQVADKTIHLLTEEKEITLSMNEIEKANLIPDLSKS